MRIRLFTGVVGAAIAVAATALTAVPATAAPAVSEVRQGGVQQVVGQTVLSIDPSMLNNLTFTETDHYAVLAEKGTTAAGLTTYTFDVVGDPTDGTIELYGGILFVRDHDFLLLSHIVTNDANRIISAKVNFTRTDVFAMGANTSLGRTWEYTEAGAVSFNEGLGLDILDGRVFGYAVTTLNTA